MKNLTLVLTFACAPLLGAQASLEAATITLNGPGSTTVSGLFTIDADISGISDLYAYQFRLGFDGSKVTPVSVSEGTFLPGGGPTAFVDLFPLVAGTLTTAVAGVSGSGTLASFQFEAIAAGLATFHIEDLILLDSTLGPLTGDTVSGTVTIRSAPEPAPEPGTLVLLALASASAFRTRHRR